MGGNWGRQRGVGGRRALGRAVSARLEIKVEGCCGAAAEEGLAEAAHREEGRGRGPEDRHGGQEVEKRGQERGIREGREDSSEVTANTKHIHRASHTIL